MFYGWVMVGIAFVAQFVAIGSLIQCYPVFLPEFVEEFGVSFATASLGTVAIMTTGIFASPLAGRAVARFPIRNVMVAGGLVMAMGCFAVARAETFGQVALLYGVVGSLALSCVGPISCNALIVNWFDRKRSMALGVAMIGMSISGAVLIPLATWGVETHGWRLVFDVFGVSALVLTLPIGLLVVTRPADMALAPDGGPAAPAATKQAATEPVAVLSTRMLLREPALWLVAAASGLVFFGSSGLMNHGMQFATERGIEPMRAAALLSALSVGAACGKLLFGWLADRLGERNAFHVTLAASFLALLGLLYLDSYAGLVGAAALYGLGIGGVAPLQAALLARGFGPTSFGPAMGLVGPLMIPFQITGPPLAGYIFDTRASYDLALWIFLGALVMGAVAIRLIRPMQPEAGAPPAGAGPAVPARP